MSNLKDLKDVGKELVPILKDLFDLIKNSTNKNDKSSENAMIQRLNKLILEGNTTTPGSLAERAEAIVAVRAALTEIIVQSTASNNPLPETTTRIIMAERNALRSAYGLLLERAVFEDIPQLLTSSEIEEISKTIRKAESEIAQRQRAKDILDTVINVAIAAANIAVKVAA
ncbi:MAG: hypothetical protein AYP45_15645 [Candidatus Brocadia carolinensis]|uniref:Uncharacterized protein n=1 Tax=Candidatus Brocadia carolinensis TaxID=1004156 RepID=A0A1V4AQD6_9BACT|nr:MAG: hypothetical protein AYP45_15645 [Candidatus Brocadia caroliniensis]